jgi:hypothetical protein
MLKKKIKVNLIYESVESGYKIPIRFKLEKIFYFNYIPIVKCKIIIKDDMIEYIDFDNIEFDPYKDLYIVENYMNIGVEKYYKGCTLTIMNDIVETFEDKGWKAERILE